jgi:hypothetical protein
MVLKRDKIYRWDKVSYFRAKKMSGTKMGHWDKMKMEIVNCPNFCSFLNNRYMVLKRDKIYRWDKVSYFRTKNRLIKIYMNLL